MNKLTVSLVLMLAFSGLWLLALDPLQVIAQPATPAAPAVDADIKAVRASLARGVLYLRKRMADNEDGWVVPPVRTRKQVGTKDVEVRFREEVVKVPVWEFEEVEVPKLVPDGSQTVLKRVKERRPVRITGHREEKRLIQDPQGAIVRTRTVPIQGEGGPDLQRHAFLAQNAMALFALLACGVDPQERDVGRLAANLVDEVNRWGPPDTTLDLVWMSAALARMPEKRDKEVATALAGKLLAGQVRDGPGQGLWGPTCVDLRQLAALLGRERAASDDLQRLAKLTAGRDPDPVLVRQKNLAAGYLDSLAHALAQVSRDGLSYQQMTGLISRYDMGEVVVQTVGQPLYFYNQVATDLESTFQVLMALDEVARFAKLPESTPVALVKKQAFIQATPARTILMDAVNALAKAQRTDGGWTSCNGLQQVRSFDRHGLLDVPLADPLPALASEQGAAATAMGLRAVIQAGVLAGPGAPTQRIATIRQKAEPALATLAEQLTKADWSGGRGKPRGELTDLSPYIELAAMTGVQGRFARHEQSHRNEWTALAMHVICQQSPRGSWGGTREAIWVSSSIRAREQVKARLEDEAKAEPKDKRGLQDRRRGMGQRLDPRLWACDAEAISTAMAMVYLAEGIRPPVVATWPPASTAVGGAPRVASMALAQLVQQQGFTLTGTPVAADFTDLQGKPAVLVLEPAAGQEPITDGTAKLLAQHLDGGGTVVLLTAPGDHKQLDTQVGRLAAASGKLKPMPVEDALKFVDHAAMSKDHQPSVTVLGHGDRPAVWALAAASRSTTTAPGVDSATALVAQLIEHFATAEVMARNYPMGVQEAPPAVAP